MNTIYNEIQFPASDEALAQASVEELRVYSRSMKAQAQESFLVKEGMEFEYYSQALLADREERIRRYPMGYFKQS